MAAVGTALVAAWTAAQEDAFRAQPAVAASAAAQAPADRPTPPFAAVDPFIGTGGEGHTYPGATVPFGMVQLSPDTDVKFFRQSFPWAAGYRHGDPTILGFSHTHFSGTGHSDLGDVLLVPTVGAVQLEPGTVEQPETGYRSRYSGERAEPGHYAVRLDEPGVDVELTATSRVGLHRYRFPTGDQAHVVLDLVSSIYNYDGKVLWSSLRVESDRRVTGHRQTKGWAPGRTIYFAIEFSQPFVSFGLVKEGEEPYRGFGRQGPRYDNYPEASGRTLRAHFDFKGAADKPLLVKVAISAVGIDAP
jgi:putative alpha-1,2-mannosidase